MTLVTVNCTDILKVADLYFVGPYPFNLTRRTRRTEQAAPYLCGFSTYDWCRVRRISLVTRRRYPTRRMVHRLVGREHRRVLVGKPTTRNPLLMLDTPADVGFVGFCEKVGEHTRGRVGGGKEMVL